MSPNYKIRKSNKKQKRCEAVIKNDFGLESSEMPTRFLAVLNAGLTTGLTEECVLQTAEPHGSVLQLLMLPQKSYCFLECASAPDAEGIFHAMHNVATIGQNGAIVFLAYFEELPTLETNNWKQPQPDGLVILSNFITAAEETDILLAINAPHAAVNYPTLNDLKHRRVWHFGYEFLYGVNNVDPNRPLLQEIPSVCNSLWPRLNTALIERGLDVLQVPDQLTVNEYEPGQGIPPHVDTHSAFLDPIMSLSLQADIVMDFRRGTERVPVLLPRRSMLIMSSAARYDWTHGITPRLLDVVPSTTGALTTRVRSKRTSLTFRRLRRTACDCNFPTLCDSRNEIKTKEPNLKNIAVSLEECNVHRVYDEIAAHFSETRHTPWPQVVDFLRSFPLGSILLDIGCGNGKYLNCNPELLTIGCDRSQGLLRVCNDNGENVFRCDCLHVPMRSKSVDGCISIAVIHHLSTPERRLAAVREMARLLRQGGRALIYVWAKNQRANAKKSSYLLQNKAINKHKSTEAQQRQFTAQQLEQQQNINDSPITLPVHTNRTEFLQQDVLVPWKLKGVAQKSNANKDQTTFLRYYHVFDETELQQLVTQLPEVQLIQSYYDQGNHCVIFQRK